MTQIVKTLRPHSYLVRLYNLLSSIGPLIKAENQVNKLCEHNGDILYVSAAQVEAAVSLALDSTACLLECVERLEDLKTLRPEVFSAGIDGGSLTSHIGSLESQCNSLKQLLGSGVNTAALMLTSGKSILHAAHMRLLLAFCD